MMIYVCETLALNTTIMSALIVAEWKMKRIVLSTTLQEKKINAWIRQHARVYEIIKTIKENISCD